MDAKAQGKARPSGAAALIDQRIDHHRPPPGTDPDPPATPPLAPRPLHIAPLH